MGAHMHIWVPICIYGCPHAYMCAIARGNVPAIAAFQGTSKMNIHETSRTQKYIEHCPCMQVLWGIFEHGVIVDVSMASDAMAVSHSTRPEGRRKGARGACTYVVYFE